MSILRSTVNLFTDPRFWGMNLLIATTLLGGFWAAERFIGASYLLGWFLGFAYAELSDWFIGRFGRPGGAHE